MLGESGSRLKIRDGEAYSVQAVKNSQSEEMQKVVHQNIVRERSTASYSYPGVVFGDEELSCKKNKPQFNN